MSRSTIHNPILPGFNPDPSICRVGDDYYVAVSTFEWYPGVQIYHSRDLRHWRLVARPLNRAELLDMRGCPDSCGVWAPCLSWADGRFWLVYTEVKRFDGNFKDTHNYITTCDSIDGDWGKPVYINSSGFDPSLFHDEDGRKWYVNMVWDHRPDCSFFRGIVIQEYCVDGQRLLGKRKFIFDGTDIDYTEAPHLYRFGDWYYLITAEGGTSYGHAVTMARSRTVDGMYEADPAGPVLTTRDDPDWPLQRNGHADIVETADGDLYLVHLCGRPIEGTRRCVLGRETGIQKLTMTGEGWLRLAHGGHLPQLEVDAPDLPDDVVDPVAGSDGFDSLELDPVYQWLRTPRPDDFMTLSERPGYLRLYGMESPGSHFDQALIARRQTHFAFEATTCMEFHPEHFQQLAGLICYYNSCKFHYLFVSADEAGRRHLGIMSCEAKENMQLRYPVKDDPIRLPREGSVWLKANVSNADLKFSWSLDGESWRQIPVTLDHSLLSDEAGDLMDGQFTGAFVGVCCNDVAGTRRHADFDFFSYVGKDG